LWKGREVALKTLKGEDQKSFQNEAKMLQKLRHPNIVEYYGIFAGDSGELYIVMEYLPLGSLNRMLMAEGRNIGLGQLVDMAKQASSGMCLLEREKVIHRDLSLRNLLVKKQSGIYIVKISDFGLSRAVETYYRSDNNIPIKWSAPEVLEYGTHSIKSDVWSFGICMWELFSYGRLPFPEYSNELARNKILQGNIMPCPYGCTAEIYNLMRWCWSQDPNQRPTFHQLFVVLDAVKLSQKTSHISFHGDQQNETKTVARSSAQPKSRVPKPPNSPPPKSQQSAFRSPHPTIMIPNVQRDVEYANQK